MPWPQKGPAVSLPLGSTAPVFGTGKALGLTNGIVNYGAYATGGNLLTGSVSDYNQNVGGTAVGTTPLQASTRLGVVTSGVSGLQADLSTATAATINALRQAFQLQRLYERDARGGTRYTEIVRSHFGVVSPDARLQRPEYLGGSTARVNLTSVAQTSAKSATGTTTPLGSLGAVGTITAKAGFTKSFTEHCVIIGLCSVRADLTYQQGLPRMFPKIS